MSVGCRAGRGRHVGLERHTRLSIGGDGIVRHVTTGAADSERAVASTD